MNPTLSVVVPAYNIAPYIEQCVRSVLAQLGEQHELIILDDGSTDQTRELVLQMQRDWPGTNFHLITQANEGLAGARNHGVRAAKGDYIVWVDGDDVLRDGVLPMLDQAIAAHRPDVIAFDYRMWHPDQPNKSHDIKLSYPTNVLMREPDEFLITFMAARRNYVWTNVIRREIYARLPDPIFPPGRVFEDLSTTPRLLSECASLLHLPKTIIDYRQHPASITQTMSEKSCMDFASGLPKSRQYLAAHGASDAVKRHFDVMAGHFFITVFKATYQLPVSAGARVRAHMRATLAESLFGDTASMLETIRRKDTFTLDRKFDLKMLKQLRKALSGNLLFHVTQTANRKLKVWRQARKLRKHNAALAQ
ncbi:MAG: glycosyltransferase family 2 protein [Pseudomonadota bacterium]